MNNKNINPIVNSVGYFLQFWFVMLVILSLFLLSRWLISLV